MEETFNFDIASHAVDKASDLAIIETACPRGGIGIHGRLRACARMGVPVRVGPGAPINSGTALVNSCFSVGES